VGKPDWHGHVVAHSFLATNDPVSYIDVGTAWQEISPNYARLDLEDAPQIKPTTCRLEVRANMVGQPTAYLALAGSSFDPNIDTDKACIVELTAGVNGYFKSAEEPVPGGMPDLILHLVMKSSQATGDIVLYSVRALFY